MRESQIFLRHKCRYTLYDSFSFSCPLYNIVRSHARGCSIYKGLKSLYFLVITGADTVTAVLVVVVLLTKPL